MKKAYAKTGHACHLVGPLSGKTAIAVAVWLVAWAAFSHQWKNQQVDFSKVFMVTLVMIALGL